MKRKPSRVALVATLLAVGCTRPLPEPESEAAKLYARRCGSCHRAYAPSATGYGTWELILPRMEKRIMQARQRPLTAEEWATIRDYLRRHSG